MMNFLIPWSISICFIIGTHMTFESIWGAIFKLLFYMLGFALIDYYGSNYEKWNRE